ncbi:hypothetical protein AHF37_05527 [Paragonimus kellicotti]|nr:hypothetical protein AHF37_05527 [Paragonimus kellicotti]
MFEQCREENWEDKLTKLGSEGCRIHGELQVNKVAGSFHIAPGSSFATNNVHVHNMQGLTDARVNMTHKISSLSFGPSYPDQVNPLDGVTMYIVEPFQMITYYMKLVPTIYIRHNDSVSFFLVSFVTDFRCH